MKHIATYDVPAEFTLASIADERRSVRNRRSQFETPEHLATEIARVVKTMWVKGRHSKIIYLEPGIGKGILFQAIQREFGEESIKSALGIELDKRIAKSTGRQFSRKLKVLQGDFLGLEPNLGRGNRPTLLVANPPYTRFQRIPRRTRIRLIESISSQLGVKPSGLSPMYSFFILLADRWLSSNSLSAWLVPSEFTETHYGNVLRRYLTDKVNLVRVHVFNKTDLQFNDVMVSSALVIFEKRAPTNTKFTFSFGGGLLHPQSRYRVQARTIGELPKWNEITLRGGADFKGQELGDLFDIKRGIATGANEYFVLDSSKVASLEIPKQFLKPVLPRPSELSSDVVDANRDGSPRLVDPLFLLDCKEDPLSIKEKYPRFWAYLQQGESSGLLKRTLIRNRKPWYSQESRSPPLFLFSYIGRRSNNGGPLKIVYNKSNAIATNNYLLLYPKERLISLMRREKLPPGAVHYALKSIDRDEFCAKGREYGGGLMKLEPSELRTLHVRLEPSP